jgi:hypothetical protein
MLVLFVRQGNDFLKMLALPETPLGSAGRFFDNVNITSG